MLLAAMLFAMGWLIGWCCTMLILVTSSVAIMVCTVTIFALSHGLDLLHVLLVLGYLAAHQSGYLLGAYCSNYQEGS
ncbi:hypothetical protein [Methylobacterium sp. NEAU K]|uniref:hypothetical protein n=1 Tax=Methylobacterium sp. NEAU K TaxID=3064946 RepID=UPI002732FEC2|nr:hypothetical protein [Methylobacterium sp. NEAU K]MDP4004456.1 hypothetical protein [Methylobacterium sp. NEAU K]